MKKQSIVSTLLALAAAPALFAEFQLVNDFEAGDTTGVTVTTSPLAAEGGNGTVTNIVDPGNAENRVLQIDPGTFANGTDTNNIWFHLPFADITGTGTLYTKFQLEGDLVDLVIGTTHVAAPGSYGDFSAIARFETDLILDYHDGSYVEVEGSAGESGAWYELWIVLNVPANTYDLWIKGGAWAVPTQVAAGADFRSNSTDPQNTFYVRMTTGDATNPKGIDSAIFDDIYVDTSGENIITPGTSSGGGGDDIPDSNSGSVGTGRMANISTRAFTGLGDQVLTGGFVIEGGSRRVLIRAVGPTLGELGVGGTLVDPIVKVIRSGEDTPIYQNDNWGDSALKAEILTRSPQVGAFALTDGSADAVIIATLPAGGYTVQVTGADGGTGIALVEVYEIR